ncbi:CDP-6-deoxy-delta-3,4-glucoseen reductase [Propionivibrio sp.]|uniref:CDP-6-deoxy-delta-3,4-glucoseen reductase n=1 Tax=Propionivibrio sp. TaxID=2212460 RepID=UPI0025FE3E10|nr:CDP-6-deoxy-delta-3,4-glucoseen reductase [Propionivibrio sp.]MBK7355050.1 CDP-6-deoxy-delta-3,4-glucoseen reductase [Propionivibrio sp.]MBK8402420.1 CDP-6-deoxy-delta-3,4-glucoseen reductase [Propionivibrio sp.]MBK8743574.1 CDP-6-deoxy-delta-3,4-glucoseen reductase [Propionivibrio sp.]MBK8892878.1 CDP-6-deoxy-delta-3,4-glucoseen reductase [Propionivibrio sp.]
MGFLVRVSPDRGIPHEFCAETDETILAAALRQGLLLPYGCRDGVCGTCRGKVVSGKIDHGKAPTSTLNEADRNAGFALFCCAKARSDLTIESREVRSAQQIPVRTLPARVQKLTRAAPDVMIIELKLPTNDRLQFLAGQYIEILLKGGRRRAFSLANAPHNDDFLQLHVRRVPGGQFTEHVFNTLKERDILRFSGPHGSFFLREDSSKPILLIAGGTGFAPIKAIVEHAIAQKPHRPMTIYWGGRERADLYLKPVPEQWALENSSIHFVPVLSDTSQCEKWCGRIGFVHAAAMQDFPDLSGHQVYVCGSPEMVAAARRDFVGKCRLPENEFFADSFEYANDEDSVAPASAGNPFNIAG